MERSRRRADPTSGDPRAVAVILAARNAQATIARAVRSALAQPQAAEICVVDDASTDATADAAMAADDGSGRLSVIRRTVNGGPSVARNAAIEATRAPWICVLDADDFFLPGRLGNLLAHAEEADLIADDLLQVLEGAEDKTPQPAWVRPELVETLDFATFVRRNISRANVHRQELGFLKPLIRRDFLDGTGIRYAQGLRLGEDYELYARTLAHGARMLLVPPAGYVAVVRPGSLSSSHGEAELRALRDCDASLAQIRPLSAQESRALREHYVAVDSKLQWVRLIAAVKSRDAKSALGCFSRSPTVSRYLIARLFEQVGLRARRKLQPRSNPE